jgi:hypothetical protein
MHTTIIVQDDTVTIYHAQGASFYKGSEKNANAAIKKIIADSAKSKVIGDAVAAADVRGTATKALRGLKPLKK